MSTQEQRDIAAKTLLEHADAKKKLAALQIKAKTYGNDFRTLADAIAPYRDQTRDATADHWPVTEALERYPTKEQLMQTIDSIQKTQDEVVTLSRSLEGMGYKP